MCIVFTDLTQIYYTFKPSQGFGTVWLSEMCPLPPQSGVRDGYQSEAYATPQGFYLGGGIKVAVPL